MIYLLWYTCLIILIANYKCDLHICKYKWEVNRSFINIYLLYYIIRFCEINWHEFCPLCPGFRIAWKLMYRYSMSIACVFTTYLVFVATYTVSTFVFVVVFEPTLLTNQQDDVKNCILVTWPGFGRAAKRTKFWAENGQIQTVETSRSFIRILSNFQFRVFE